MYEDIDSKKLKTTIKKVVLGIFGLITLLASFGTIGAGEKGITTQFGAVTGEVKDAGLYIILPFIQDVKKVNVQVQKEQVEVGAASSDLQTVSSQVALNYRLEPTKVAEIYKSVGLNYKDTVIAPALQEAVKASTARYTAEELITKRETVKMDVKNILTEKLAGRGIVVDDLNIVDFDFSDSFNKAIEDKVTAEQNALAAKNKLEQIKYEASQNIETAKGKAEAIRIESEALRSNPDILQLKAIEKWDGKMPQVTSGATPFIEVK